MSCTMRTVLFLSLLTIALGACPFSKDQLTCTCSDYSIGFSGIRIYNEITCQVGQTDTLPKFNESVGQYSADRLNIEFVHPIAFYIEAESFVDFKEIGWLTLNSPTDEMSISWDSKSLVGTTLYNFKMENIFHFNSGFAALASDEKKLASIELDNGGAYHLGGGDLQNFTNLHKFLISDTEISTIDQKAFQGLEFVINVISLTDASVGETLVPAIGGLELLQRLNLSGNDFKSFDLAWLPKVQGIVIELDLSRNDQMETLNSSSEDAARNGPYKVIARNTGLKTLSSSLEPLLSRPQIQTSLLDVSNNKNLICDEGIQWTAKYALCKTGQILIDDSTCANLQNQSLHDYLTNSVPNPCK